MVSYYIEDVGYNLTVSRCRHAKHTEHIAKFVESKIMHRTKFRTPSSNSANHRFPVAQDS
jgi:hypothetical protein